jgi:hypothetical protein
VEVLVVFLVLVVVHGGLLSSPGVVNLGTSSAASALNNVVQINLFQSIIICVQKLDCQTFHRENNGTRVAGVYLVQHSARACCVSYLIMKTAIARDFGSSTHVLFKLILLIVVVVLIVVLIHGGGVGDIILSSLSLALALSKGILAVRVGDASSVRHFEHGYLCDSELVRTRLRKWL